METVASRHYPRAIAMLIGTIIGAGIFGIPYVVAASGMGIGLIHFVVLTIVVLLIHLFFGELTLRTNEHHRLVGYAAQYFGVWGKRIATVTGVLGMYGVLLAYLIVSGSFLQELIGPFLGGTAWQYSIVFGVLGALAISRGLRLVEEMEFVLTAFLFVAVAVIFIVGLQRVDPLHWTTLDTGKAFLPYGAILFGLGGASVIAEIRDVLRGREQKFAQAITWGTIIAALVNLLFVAVVVGVSGSATSPEAIAGLAPTLGHSIVILGALLGIFAIATSFLALGLYTHEVFRIDFHLPKYWAFFLSIIVPIIIFAFANPSFTKVILITGAIFGGIDGILIALLVLRARKFGNRTPEFHVRLPFFVNWLIVAFFIVGIIATVVEVCSERWCGL